MKDFIYALHPVVSFAYFAFVLAFSMYFMHPVTLCISLLGALSYSIYLKGKRALGFGLKFMLPMIVIVSIMNPLFNHQGATILEYLWDGNPLTLESITYGIASGCMLICVICWFSCFNEIITSDKIIYLFGRVIPALSLILSMSLRFVPRFKAQMLVISDAQRCVGRDVSNGSIIKRAKHSVMIISIMITWALENAIETADSMKSRGYGLKGRTAFSNFRFDKRDKYVLTAIFVCVGIIITGAMLDGLKYRYYPTMKGTSVEPMSIFLFLDYLILCMLPLILNLREDWKWTRSKSML